MAHTGHLRTHSTRTQRRLRTIERLTDRLLLAADLNAVATPDLIPLEPAENGAA